MHGWRKNLFVAGRTTLPFGGPARHLFPLLALTPPLFTLAPVVLLLLGSLGSSATLAVGGMVATAAALVWWVGVHRKMKAPLGYALLFPLGAAVLLAIVVQSIAQGSRVAWKGREYIAR
jgi:hypothetical protein